MVCNSCKTKVTNSKGTARFMCPNCSKHEIVRCMHCREISAKYVCPQCNFTGPN
ncbi:RNA-binding protein [Candidatus Woesearchaeota archaeon]|nr:RNA-binding protein [Candidatus Woesearchaeota archaeon]